MIKIIIGLGVGLWLTLGLTANAQAQTQPSRSTDGQVIVVAESPLDGVNEILRLEPSHLLFLGAGILGGALVISPNLGLGEVLGVVLGVIVAEYSYRTFYRSHFSLW